MDLVRFQLFLALLTAAILGGCGVGEPKSYEDCVLEAIAERNRSPVELDAIQEACRQEFPPTIGKLLPPEVTLLLQGRAGRNRYGQFSGKIYNPTDWTITTLEISLGPADGDTLSRRTYRISELDIEPRTAASFSVSFLDEGGEGELKWAIEHAWGKR